MKVNYADYIKRSDVSVLVAEAIFSELYKTYTTKTIGEIADTSSGGTPLRTNNEFHNGEIPWIKSGELNDGFIESAEEFISEKGLANSSARLYPEGTLLLAMYGATAGKTGITKIRAATNQAVCALFPKKDVKRDYLYWFLRQHRYKFIEISKGGAQPNISQTVIKQTLLPLPKVDEQEIIINILASLQNKEKLDLDLIPDVYRDIVSKVFYTKQSVTSIESENNNQLQILKIIRQQILFDALQGKLIVQDMTDEPAIELLRRILKEKKQKADGKKSCKEEPLTIIKSEEIPFKIPDNWIWCRLGEITNYGSSPKAEPSDITFGTWVLDLEDIEKETSKLLCKIRFSERESLSTKSVFKKGDVLYSKLRPYLDKVIVADEDGVCTTEILPLHCYSNLSPKYLRIALKRKDFLYYVNSVTKGMKMPRLGTLEGKLALIPLCPVAEQYRIVEKVEQLFQLCDDLEQFIIQNQKYTQELLHVALKEALEN